jgi:hypothetical protein
LVDGQEGSESAGTDRISKTVRSAGRRRLRRAIHAERTPEARVRPLIYHLATMKRTRRKYILSTIRYPARDPSKMSANNRITVVSYSEYPQLEAEIRAARDQKLKEARQRRGI